MASYTQLVLSGSTDGKPIKVAGTAIGSATTIHTGSSSTSDQDTLEIYACNTSAGDVLLTITAGGDTDPDNVVSKYVVKAQDGIKAIIPLGLTIKGNATPIVVKAFAATANVITIIGKVIRRTA